MSLKDIIDKNKTETTLLGSSITKQLNIEDAEYIRKYFKSYIEPINEETYENYIEFLKGEMRIWVREIMF